MKKRNDDINFIDRFLYKLFFVFIILFIVVFLDKINILDYEKIKKEMSKQINILEVVDVICGDSNFFALNLDFDTTVSKNDLVSVDNIESGYLVNIGSYQAVESLNCAIVMKITEHDDGTFSVLLKGRDGNEYNYSRLTTVDVNLYQVLVAKDIIGQATLKEQSGNIYELLVTNNGQRVDYYN